MRRNFGRDTRKSNFNLNHSNVFEDDSDEDEHENSDNI